MIKQRLRAICVLLAAIAWCYFAPMARGGEFQISLELKNGENSQSAKNGEDAMKDKLPAKRVTMTAAPDARLLAAWKVAHAGGSPAADVLVHFYVVRIERSGQAPPPLDPKAVSIESALTMDFEKETSTEAELDFRPREAGVYLVRIEAKGSSTESFAEMELVVKEGQSK